MFSHLVGNEEVKTRLVRMLANERLPHSMLFTGPEGIGKKLFAVEIARSFVCSSPVENRACGECPACKRVTTFNTPTSEKGDDYDHVFFSEHADVGLVIPFKRNLRVGAIRALETQANFRPYESRARVFIIDDAEKMNDAASNALLKTLEEPPETTYIILLTSRPDSLLSTIRSRCQMVRFAPVSLTAIATMLRESKGLSSDDARLLAKISGGSMGKAIDLDLESYRTERELHLGTIRSAMIDTNRSKLITSSERLNDAKNKDRFEENLAIIETLIRDLWLVKNGSQKDAINNFDIFDILQQMADQIDRSKLAATLAEIEELRGALMVNINRKTATDTLFLKMSA
jgi:DNA polymerase-3 subunit delta'